jgi:hypothetical protein
MWRRTPNVIRFGRCDKGGFPVVVRLSGACGRRSRADRRCVWRAPSDVPECVRGGGRCRGVARVEHYRRERIVVRSQMSRRGWRAGIHRAPNGRACANARATLVAIRPAGSDAVAASHQVSTPCSLQLQTLPGDWPPQRAQIVRAQGLLRFARPILVVAPSPRVSGTARAPSRLSSTSRRATMARSPATRRSMVRLAR